MRCSLLCLQAQTGQNLVRACARSCVLDSMRVCVCARVCLHVLLHVQGAPSPWVTGSGGRACTRPHYCTRLPAVGLFMLFFASCGRSLQCVCVCVCVHVHVPVLQPDSLAPEAMAAAKYRTPGCTASAAAVVCALIIRQSELSA